LTGAILAPADAIRIQDEWLEGVHIVEGARLYFVLVPEDGRVINVRKDEVGEDDIRLNPDASARTERRAVWSARDAANREHRDASSDNLLEHVRDLRASLRVSPTGAENRTHPAQTNPKPPRHVHPGNTDGPGMTPGVSLRNVPLGTALQATLRPMGLDYRDMGGYLLVSSPQRLRHEAMEPLETRSYAIAGDATYTLPKIVLGNPSGAMGGGVAAFQGAQGGFSPFAQQGFGGSGGMGGGFGGGFRGGGMGGFGGDVTVISNISDLFSTIDDRLVGEAPATLPGLQIR
jgi:hypothetical protein